MFSSVTRTRLCTRLLFRRCATRKALFWTAVIALFLIIVVYDRTISALQMKPNVILDIPPMADKTEDQSGFPRMCPLLSPNLVGSLTVDMHSPTYDDIQTANPEVQTGGRYKPHDCTARHRVAIIIPYRNREPHLRTLLNNLHPFLRKQQLDYGIFVVELAEPTTFNKALLFNIAYLETSKIFDYQCLVFHDVDMIPENDRNIYSCPRQPRHMAAAVDKFGYSLPYEAIFGGVTAFRKEHIQKMNGFSNMYFGWGGEDDDIYNRIIFHNMSIMRYPPEYSRYKMIQHGYDGSNLPNPDRYQLLYRDSKDFAADGLNSVKYQVLKIEFKQLYTRIYVSVNESEIKQRFRKTLTTGSWWTDLCLSIVRWWAGHSKDW